MRPRTTRICERDAVRTLPSFAFISHSKFSGFQYYMACVESGMGRGEVRQGTAHALETCVFSCSGPLLSFGSSMFLRSRPRMSAATGFHHDCHCSSFTSFTGEAVKGGDAFDWPIGSPLRQLAVAWCIRLPRRSKYASAGRSRASHAGSAHAMCCHLAAATVASLFPLHDEDEMVDASCAGTLSATDLLRVVLLISMWR
jgi:hypothetical protein